MNASYSSVFDSHLFFFNNFIHLKDVGYSNIIQRGNFQITWVFIQMQHMLCGRELETLICDETWWMRCLLFHKEFLKSDIIMTLIRKH